MEEKLLSVVVPMYNVEEYILRCLESLQKQDIPEEQYEIILIDDGSRDRTVEYAKEFSQNHKNIRIISQKNGGASVARNRGIDEARGKYIWFVDADDYVLENRFGILLEKAIGNDLDILSFDT
ncbi:MAG: glycosyltransferase, partial [Fusobacteriaceae bacterium]